MADKKSNPSQIAQAVLDENKQAIKVTVVGGGGGPGTGTEINLVEINGATVSSGVGSVTAGTQRVVLASNQPTIPVDIQDTEIAISMDKDEDSVTIYTPNNNTTPIPVNVESFPTPLTITGAGTGSSALRVQLADESLAALETINVTVTNTALEITNDAGNPIPISIPSLPAGTNNIGDVDIASVPAPLNVIGSGAAASSLRVHLSDEALDVIANPNVDVSVSVTTTLPTDAARESKQDVQTLELQAIKGHVDGLEGLLTSEVSASNSTTTPLGINGVFTGSSFDAKDFATLSISVTADQSSAVNGISVQFSQDGVNWDHIHVYTYTAGGNGLSYNLPVEMRYVRIVYTNGAIAQTSMRLQSVFRRTSVPPSVYTIDQGIYDSTIASPVKSVIFGKTTGGGGGYVAVKVNPSGALTTEVTGSVEITNPTLAVTNSNITEAVATAARQDSQTTELQAIKGHVDQVEAKLDTLISQTDGVEGSLSSIDTKVSTAANQVSTNTKLDTLITQTDGVEGSLSSIDGKLNSLGQKTSAASVPVVVASDQSALPVTQSGTWNITDVTGTVSLPTGAATSAKQDTQIARLDTLVTQTDGIEGSLSSIDTKVSTSAKQDTQIARLDTLITQTDGIEASLTSIDTKVATSANQVSTNTKLDTLITQTDGIEGSLSSIDTKVSTSAKQDTQIDRLDTLITQTDGIEGSLSSIDGKLNSLGQKAMTGSVPVVVASDNVVTVNQLERHTYSAGLADLVPAATATDIMTITGGNANKVIKIYKIHISGFATNNSIFDLNLIRRSTPNSGGTFTSITPVKFDTNNPDSNTIINRYTANPTTLGTSVGVICQSILYLTSSTNLGNSNYIQGGSFVEMNFGLNGMQPLTLRGTSETIAINLDGQTITGGNLEIDIWWTEENV